MIRRLGDRGRLLGHNMVIPVPYTAVLICNPNLHQISLLQLP